MPFKRPVPHLIFVYFVCFVVTLFLSGCQTTQPEPYSTAPTAAAAKGSSASAARALARGRPVGRLSQSNR